MSDFELLKYLQKELITTLTERKTTVVGWIARTACKAKIHRLRLQINEVMLRIERKCNSTYKYKGDKESWE